MPRFFVWRRPAPIIAALAALLLAGCGAERAAPTLINIDQAATQTAWALLAAPETFIYRGVNLSGLCSYQAVLTLSFSGVIGGVESRASLGMDAHVEMGRPAASVRVSVGGDAGVFGDAFPQVGTFTKTYLGGVDYITGVAATEQGTCLARRVNLFDPLAYNVLSPNQFLAPDEVPPLSWVGQARPTAEAVPTWHFYADGFSTSTLETATLEVWTTDGGAYVVRLDLQGEGYLPGQTDAHGAVTMHYELCALNQQVQVALPTACVPVTPPPLLGGGG